MRHMLSVRALSAMLCLLVVPAMAQVPRTVFAELNSATW